MPVVFALRTKQSNARGIKTNAVPYTTSSFVPFWNFGLNIDAKS